MTEINVTTAAAPSSDAAPASTSTPTAPVASPATSTPTTAPASGSTTEPLRGKGLTLDQVDAKFDEQLAKATATAAEKKADTEAEQHEEPTTADEAKAPDTEGAAKTETKEEKPSEQSDADKAPPKVREALKAIPDDMLSKEMKKDLAERYYIAEAYKRSGMPISDIPRYLEYGTLDDLETMRQHSELLQGISGDFESGDTAGLDRMNGVLRTHNPEAYSAWLGRAVADLETVNPKAWFGIAETGVRHLLANLRNDAVGEKNEDHSVVADYLEEYLGWKPGTGAPSAPAAPARSPEEERLLREAADIKAREERRVTDEQQAIHNSFMEQSLTQARTLVGQAIAETIDERAVGLEPEQRDALAQQVGAYVEAQMKKHPTVASRIDELVKREGYTQASFQKVTDYVSRLAKGFIPFGAEQALKPWATLVGERAQNRAKKVDAVIAKREVSSGGAVPPPTIPKLSGKNKTVEQVDAEFDQLINMKRV